MVKTVYCYYWDLVHDWGLMKPGHAGLRDRATLTFRPSTYYVCMLTNLTGRIAWTLTLSGSVLDPRYGPLFAVVEILRRCQWNVFRLEHRRLQAAAEDLKAEAAGAAGGGGGGGGGGLSLEMQESTQERTVAAGAEAAEVKVDADVADMQ